MTTRQVIAAGVVTGALLVAGCGSGTSADRKVHQTIVPSAAEQPAEVQARPDAAPNVDQMDASAGSADMLARKTESYSREMAALLASRQSSPRQPAPAPAPSAVQWLDPSGFDLSLGPRSAGAPRQAATEEAPSDHAARPAAERAEPSNAGAVASIEGMPQIPQVRRSEPLSSDLLAQKFSRRVKDYPRDVSAHLEYQLLQFLLDEPAPQLSVLSTLPAEDRELVTAVLDGLTNFRNALRADSNMLQSQKIKPILALAERLRAQADLTIPTIELCTRVNGFGNYERIEPARFAANADHPVIVYCEIANFTSNLNDRQQWETRLTWDMTLYNEAGMSVWSDKTESISDAAYNRRHDFFVRKMITLPRSLTIGRYLLKVSIVDTQSNRIAEATAPLVIGAQ